MLDESEQIRERFEALEDELNVLKNEIKQNLVDLREFIMKERTIFPDGAGEPPRAMRVDGNRGQRPIDDYEQRSANPPIDLAISRPEDIHQVGSALAAIPSERGHSAFPVSTNSLSNQPNVTNVPGLHHPPPPVDATMMSNIIWWLGTVKQRGLTLQQISPFLEAYEMSGYLSPAMSKLIIRSMADMVSPNSQRRDESFAPQEYADCLLQLNNIICTPGYIVDRGISTNHANHSDSTGLPPAPAAPIGGTTDGNLSPSDVTQHLSAESETRDPTA